MKPLLNSVGLCCRTLQEYPLRASISHERCSRPARHPRARSSHRCSEAERSRAAPRNTKPAFRGKPQAPAFPTVAITSACPPSLPGGRGRREQEAQAAPGTADVLPGSAWARGNAGCHRDRQGCGSGSQRRSCRSLLPLYRLRASSVPPPPLPAQPRCLLRSRGTRRGAGRGWRGSLPGCSGHCASPPACPRRSGGTPERSGPWRRWVAFAFPRRLLPLSWYGRQRIPGGQGSAAGAGTAPSILPEPPA